MKYTCHSPKKIFTRFFFFTFLFFLMSIQVFSQEKLTAFKGKVPGGYNFWLHQPDTRNDTMNKPIPLILFLHGKSLSGSNMENVKRYGVLREVIKKRDIPAIVLAPQCPRGKSWEPEKIMKVVEYVQKNYNTDTNRFYVVGMSMGGYGVLRFAGAYPERIAAAVALCGGGFEKDGCKLSTIPLWIMHGTSDRAVPFSESEKIVKSIQKCNNGLNLKYDLLDNVGHGELARFFSMDELYDWLFLHTRANPMVTLTDTISVDHDLFLSRNKRQKKGEIKHITKKEIIEIDSVSVDLQTAEKNAPKSTANKSKTHIVKKGDTLSKIAKQNHTTTSKLCKLNHLNEKSILKIGQKIIVH